MDNQINKNALLAQLKTAYDSGLISRLEIESIFTSSLKIPSFSQFNFRSIINIIGVIIVTIGLIFYISMSWSDWNFTLKVLFTFGLSAFSFFSATYFNTRDASRKLFALVFFIYYCLLLPLGIFVVCNHFLTGSNYEVKVIITSLLSAMMVFGSHFKLKKPELVVAITVYVTAGILAFVENIDFIPEGVLKAILTDERKMQYTVLLLGVAYLIYSWKRLPRTYPILTGLYNFFGSVFIIVSGFALNTSYQTYFNSSLWIFFYPIVLASSYYSGVLLKSRIVLVVSSLGLIAEVYYIADKYFSDTLGFPFTLIITGITMLVISYSSFSINRNLFKK